MYEVQVLEEDKDDINYGEWYPVSLEMCSKERHCGCVDREAGLENCDHFFSDTNNKQVAEDYKKVLEEQGTTARVKEVN